MELVKFFKFPQYIPCHLPILNQRKEFFDLRILNLIVESSMNKRHCYVWNMIDVIIFSKYLLLNMNYVS